VPTDIVDLNRADGGHQIAAAVLAQRIFRRFAGLQRGGHDAGIGADRQGVVIIVIAAGQHHELTGTLTLGEGAGAPARLVAALGGDDPDLEDLGGDVLHIVFAVGDAGARAHHLDVAGLGAALVAQIVLMGDRALADIGDDLHVAVRVRGKPVCGAMMSSFHTRRLPQLVRAGS
jgi:hypothetical protein